MTKILPLQIAGMVYDALRKGIKHKYRPNMHQHFKELVTKLHEFAKSGD
jgi:hypothetical protein